MADTERQQFGSSDDPADLVEERHPIRAAEPRLDWRRSFLTAEVLLIGLGVWLMISPFVLSLGGGEGWMPGVGGAAIAVVSVLALVGRVPGLVAAWTAFGVGAGIAVGGLALSDSSEASWNAAAGGALAAFLAVAAAAASADRQGADRPGEA